MRWWSLVPVLLIWGCMYRGSAEDVSLDALRAEAGWIVVSDVPLLLEDAEEASGAAALAMVLTYFGAKTSTLQVMRAVPVGEDSALLVDNLRNYAEMRGLTTFMLHGEVAVLERELRSGRPVIVGVVKAFGLSSAVARYEVVVGYHPEQRRVLTLDPTRGLQTNSLAGFDDEWHRSGRLTLVLMPRAAW